ncbi:ATP-binding protein [Actinosynnema sp. NPDC023587]|uniref:AAA family ATPase n=1 Tax=Actinosynnema sp. NPDC023587 TaxID=3154695 RepID=UPI0033D80973
MGNHRSFRDEQELLLIPAYAKDRQAVPVAAVYGANASGKSNLLDGLKFMADAVRDSFGKWSPDGGVPRRPFRPAPGARDQPSVFAVEFVDGRIRYVYGFEVDDERVRTEWLHSYPEKRKRVIFERDRDEIKFGTTVGEQRGKLDVLEGLLRSNALFLSLAGQTNLPLLQPAHRWFTQGMVFRLEGPETDESEIRRFLLESVSGKRFAELAKVADFGIARLSLGLPVSSRSDVEFSDSRLRVGVPLLLETAPAFIDPESLGVLKQILVKNGQLTLGHGTGEEFDLEDESAGTRAWLGLLPAALTVLDRGGLLVVDEIDASLHPQLTGRLVALFRDEEANPHRAQLVFTTHDASLLSPSLGDEVLKRDEIWFVEKKSDGASELYPLTDFHPRKEGENLERRYLGGSYGAVPSLVAEDFIDALRGSGGADDPA